MSNELLGKCPSCGDGGEMRWLAGAPAHPDNRYCDFCGWKAWEKPQRRHPMSDIDEALDRILERAHTYELHRHPSVKNLDGLSNDIALVHQALERQREGFENAVRGLEKLFADRGWEIFSDAGGDKIARRYVHDHIGINLHDLVRVAAAPEADHHCKRCGLTYPQAEDGCPSCRFVDERPPIDSEDV